ncbi:hypothetical protein QFC19_003914 [Naganishia cerealis]|uniref:Uncharacterized protein n=1 Tax=Naganishia cerealis TaxID=610337 RepID=A0ACC2VZZ5_9TREE|nr:hypothetical protein QFC19_003914 [Naganishia cerealis]
MSHHNTLNDLGLGAPIGGASTTNNNFNTSHTSAGAPVAAHQQGHEHASSGLTGSGGSSGLTGSSGATGGSSGLTGDRNTTSGDLGVGRGSGGPTAFESDASKVGEHRSVTDRLAGDDNSGRHTGSGVGERSATDRLTGSGVGERSATDRLTGDNHHHQHTTGSHEHGSHGVLSSGQGAATAAGLTGAGAGLTSGSSHHHDHDHHDHDHHDHHDRSTTGAGVGSSDLRDREAGIDAGLGAGHHDQSTTGNTRSTSGSQGLTSGSQELSSGSHSHSHHSGAAAATAGAAAVGAGGIALSGRQATKIDADGKIADSVTGQTHFVDSSVSGYAPQSTGTTTTTTGTSGLRSGSGLGAGAGAGAAGLGAGTGAAGLASHGQGHGHGGSTEGGPISELKQELKEHQSGHGAEHPESKGPHGLVWHNGKYVHEREISGHGSTGVPLR